MATTAISISKTVWTRITAAGESGTCWKQTGGTIVIDHTDSDGSATLPLSAISVTVAKSKRVPLNADDIGVLEIPADNVSDVFYALATNDNSANVLVADVI